ncbi:H/ACA ribonucleoprotein complex subunit GAR1 [Halapricum desulfuricans]|uniref:RNA-binding protein involved in rRNA processing n=1 Tax=Halapricum desulfuricans TaxID=2841257 RepID=A0A897N7Q5_9EURY|nr:Gar1/Naf1 family protein [Halapricum desulfuricans]QSG08822.1 RNA-binding protein involved in rRNA processing [Halapricum desulfuricans]
MQRAGTVTDIAQNVAIVRCPDDDHPEIGARLLDENLDTVGRVVDVFGPVERPFLAVSPDDGVRPASLLGAVLYYRDS